MDIQHLEINHSFRREWDSYTRLCTNTLARSDGSLDQRGVSSITLCLGSVPFDHHLRQASCTFRTFYSLGSMITRTTKKRYQNQPYHPTPRNHHHQPLLTYLLYSILFKICSKGPHPASTYMEPNVGKDEFNPPCVRGIVMFGCIGSILTNWTL